MRQNQSIIRFIAKAKRYAVKYEPKDIENKLKELGETRSMIENAKKFSRRYHAQS